MNNASELSAVILNLCAEKSSSLPATNGHMVHGAFMRMASAHSTTLAEMLHIADQDRPFTLSSLRGDLPPAGKSGVGASSSPVIPVTAGGHYWIRITSLTSDLSVQLMEMLDNRQGVVLRVGAVPFRIVGYDLYEHNRAGEAAYADLREECLSDSTPPLPWFGWSFISATAIHSGGRNLLFPEPSAIFPRLVQRWNLFCPGTCRLPCNGGKDFAVLTSRSLMVAANRLHTHMLEFGSRGRQIGFTGYVEYRPDKTSTVELLRLFHLLGRFSFFSGIGYSTAKGMGQVDFIIP